MLCSRELPFRRSRFFFIKRKDSAADTDWAGRRLGGWVRMCVCACTVQQRGWGSRLKPCCSASVLPLGVPHTKGKTGYWQRGTPQKSLLCTACESCRASAEMCSDTKKDYLDLLFFFYLKKKGQMEGINSDRYESACGWIQVFQETIKRRFGQTRKCQLSY